MASVARLCGRRYVRPPMVRLVLPVVPGLPHEVGIDVPPDVLPGRAVQQRRHVGFLYRVVDGMGGNPAAAADGGDPAFDLRRGHR